MPPQQGNSAPPQSAHPEDALEYLPTKHDTGVTAAEERAVSCSAVQRYLKKSASEACSVAAARKRLPILQWLPAYTLSTLLQDAVAGITVGLTAIPQGIAYAVVAGLPPQYGLYAGFMGAFVYIFLGSCKDITIGPTAILSLMTQDALAGKGVDFAILLSFLTGCIITAFGILHLGFLVDFISMPVTTAFTSAAAITIAFSQLKGLLGIGGTSNDFLESWSNLVERITYVQLWDVVLGVCTIIGLLFLQKLNDIDKGRDLSGSSKARKALSKLFWFLALSRNAIACIIGTLLAYLMYTDGNAPFSLTGEIQSGLPPFSPPPFSTTYQNETYSFPEMVSALGTNIITLPLIAILESVAIAKAFAGGKPVDATQEMLALGVCNIAGSLFYGMPITGSFTRTAVNHSSGVKTTMGGLFTGALVLLALAFLTSTFFFLPKATLSAIILAAMFFMVDVSVIPLLWRTRRIDLIPYFITFLACLFIGLELGMVIGVGVNLIFILYDAARPKIIVKERSVFDMNVLLVAPQQNLMFPGAEYIREEVVQMCSESQPAVVIIDGAKVKWIDATVAKVVKLLMKDVTSTGSKFLLWRWNKQTKDTLIAMDEGLRSFFFYSETPEDVIKEAVKPHRET
ncbi:sodium-independent sulfate anion transporter-like [Schistocerca nitens]|uniref:sodium-independent sulfate anion transporter-like n=1 Tax=Schistocerca nitens TaxID=7011 RepID=UPI002118E10C|nr:sodium-independent sulfate anion transporter-like [Schistocerca nitens]